MDLIVDGFPASRLFNQGYSYTYDDVIFLPHYIDFPTDAVSLSTKLSRRVALAIPCVSSPMDTVTESSMATAMASLGGIGILHYNTPASNQAALLRRAKSHRIPFTHEIVCKSISDSILSAEEFGSASCIFVTESGSERSKFLGFVRKSDWGKLEDKEARVSDYMTKSSITLPASYNIEDIADYDLILCFGCWLQMQLAVAQAEILCIQTDLLHQQQMSGSVNIHEQLMLDEEDDDEKYFMQNNLPHLINFSANANL